MNTQIRWLGVFLLVLYTALFARLNQVQLFGAERLRENPLNTRPLVRDFGQARGAIQTADGVVVALSVELGDDSQFDRRRTYPEGELYAQVTGYFSFNFGAAGVEETYNEELSGQTIEQQFGSFGDLFSDARNVGNVTLTLRDDLQRVARDQLGDQKGSVVAVDPRTGAILAAYSFPSYDPNPLADVDAASANAAFEALVADPANTLLERWYRELYAPGSTFKVVTASAGLSAGAVTVAAPEYPAETSYTAPGTSRPLQNFAGRACGGTLFEILARSCNTAFAQMGAEHIGPAAMVERAEAFGFNTRPPIDLPAAAPSAFPVDYGARIGTIDGFYDREPDPDRPSVDYVEDTPRLAQVSIGQNDVKSTPLQMALTAAAIANEQGQIMAPHVVSEVRDQGGDVLETVEPELWRQAVLPSVAATMREAMVGVVAGPRGTASRLATPGLVVGGKTGTAQLGLPGETLSHAWIIAFAGPPGQPAEIAVAVLVEAQPGAGDEQTGGRFAAPIAQAVIAQAFAG